MVLIWMRRALGIIEKTTLPGEIVGEVRPTLDTFGWDKLSEPERQSVQVVGTIFEVSLPPAGDDELLYVFAVDVVHTDGVSAKDIGIFLVDDTGLETSISTTIGLSANFHRSVGFPVVVPPRFLLRARSRNAIITPSLFTISALFVRLDVGEYIPAAPYG